MGKKRWEAKFQADEDKAKYLFEAQTAAYNHGIDPNAWRAQKATAIAGAVEGSLQALGGDAAAVLTGGMAKGAKGGSMNLGNMPGGPPPPPKTFFEQYGLFILGGGILYFLFGSKRSR